MSVTCSCVISYPETSWLRATHINDRTASVNQSFENNLAGSSALRTFTDLRPTRQQAIAVIGRLSAESASGLTYAAVGRIHYWLLVSSWPSSSGPCQTGLSVQLLKPWPLISSEQRRERARESAGRTQVMVCCHKLIPEVTIPSLLPLSIRWKLLGPARRQGEKIKGTNMRKVGNPWSPSPRRLPLSCSCF